MNIYTKLKPFVGKVIECSIVSVDERDMNAIFADIPVRCAMSRVSKHLVMTDKMPIYMAKAEADHLEGNLHSLKIPEQLLKKRMSYMKNLYLRCIFRKAGEFSKIVSSRRVDKSVIRRVEALLHERIFVTVLTREQLQAIKAGKLPLKHFKRGKSL
jgi:hypothetical protein